MVKKYSIDVGQSDISFKKSEWKYMGFRMEYEWENQLPLELNLKVYNMKWCKDCESIADISLMNELDTGRK